MPTSILRAVLAFGRERSGHGPCRESESRGGQCCLAVSSKREAPGGVRKWYQRRTRDRERGREGVRWLTSAVTVTHLA